ncbi:MAG: hypothetical protein ABI944_01695 [Chthoniobacterales bacterium]
MIAPAQSSRRSPLALGWEAARANAIPAFILQGLMLLVLLAYYWSSHAAAALNALAGYKERNGVGFVIAAAITAGALVPELFVIFFFQRGKFRKQNLRNLLFTIPIWGLDGVLVDLMYRCEARWFGNVATFAAVFAKICVDQLGYNPFFAAPFEVMTYEWKNSGFSLSPLRAVLRWDHYRDKIIPTLLATWAVWIPLMAIIYSLPLALQFPLFSIALTFWVLLLTYMTNRFAGRIEADAPPALAVAAPVSR